MKLSQIGAMILIIAGILAVGAGVMENLNYHLCFPDAPVIFCGIDFMLPSLAWTGIGTGLFVGGGILLFKTADKTELADEEEPIESKTPEKSPTTLNLMGLSIVGAFLAMYALPLKEIAEPMKTIVFAIIWMPSYGIMTYEIVRYFQNRRKKNKEATI